MSRENVKFLSSSLAAFMCLSLLVSGVYNTYVVGFRLSDTHFPSELYSIQGPVSHKLTPSKTVANIPDRPRVTRQRNKSIVANSVSKNNSVDQNLENSKRLRNVMGNVEGVLNLKLVEFSNTRMFKESLKYDQLYGSLTASYGQIDAIEVELPNMDFAISLDSLKGNVFTYNYDGEYLSGVIYQTGDSEYTVNLVNGPYQGSRMKFSNKDYGARTLSHDPRLDDSVENYTNQKRVDATAGSYQQDYQANGAQYIESENYPQDEYRAEEYRYDDRFETDSAGYNFRQ